MSERLERLKKISERVLGANDIASNEISASSLSVQNDEWSNLSHFRDIPVLISDIQLDVKLNSIEDLQGIDGSVFSEWRALDIPAMLLAGTLGSLSSAFLKDFFADLHDRWGKRPAGKGGHGGEGIDWVPGAKSAGGFDHRFKFGHDLLNPFEVDWSEYQKIASKMGLPFSNSLGKVFLWLRHLLQDTFSRQGLPLPGHSYIRNLLDFNNPESWALHQVFGTIKMRDLVGTGLTNGLMVAYLYSSGESTKSIFVKPNYRAFSLMAGANLINIIVGLLVPPPATSFNVSAIPITGYYAIQLILLEKRVRDLLKRRDAQLDQNGILLNQNYQRLLTNDLFIEKYEDDLRDFEVMTTQYRRKVMERHNQLKHRILGGIE